MCRAALEAAAYQTCDVVAAMEADSGVALTALKVDGGMVASDVLMQFQADMLGRDVVRERLRNALDLLGAPTKREQEEWNAS